MSHKPLRELSLVESQPLGQLTGSHFLDLEVLFHAHGLGAGSKQESSAETAATVLLIVQPVQMIVPVALRVMPPLLAFTTQDTTVPTALAPLQLPVGSSARE